MVSSLNDKTILFRHNATVRNIIYLPFYHFTFDFMSKVKLDVSFHGNRHNACKGTGNFSRCLRGMKKVFFFCSGVPLHLRWFSLSSQEFLNKFIFKLSVTGNKAVFDLFIATHDTVFYLLISIRYLRKTRSLCMQITKLLFVSFMA